jgi:hypothetical protein
LRGRHTAVSCASCHAGYPERLDRPAFGSCASCHADSHAGQATLAGRAVDCASCHSVSGFSPSTYTVSQHDSASYPLEGKHRAVSCAGCHVSLRASVGAPASTGGARVASPVNVMRPTFSTCQNCHADDHGSQLLARDDKGACESCHRVGGWSPSTFSVAQHGAAAFQLTGKHRDVACASCHAAERAGLAPHPSTLILGRARVALRTGETSCVACHRDPHPTGFAAGTGADSLPAARGCAACHNTSAFFPSTIDAESHSRFRFALEGAHRAAPCASCHSAMGVSDAGSSLKLSQPQTGRTPRVYSIPGATCATCHMDPHGGQFASREGGSTCDACHGVTAFTPATEFDHEAPGGFSLRGAHARVACTACHTVAGSEPRRWRGVPRTCEACHRAAAREKRPAPVERR